MKILYIFFLICFVFLSKISIADTAYQHFSIDELKLANSLIKAYKSGNVEEYKKYIESNRALRNAF